MRKKKQKTLLVLLLAVVLMLQYTVSIGFMSAYAGEEDNKVETTQDKPSASEKKEEAKPAPKEEPTQATEKPETKPAESDSNKEETKPAPTEDAKLVNITWKDEDGKVLEEDVVKEGTVPSYDGELPTKESTEKYSYVFNGWSPTVKEVTKDTTYTATYTASPKGMTLRAAAAKGPEDGYVATKIETKVEGQSNNQFTKAVRAWRDLEGYYYIAVASRDQNNEADQAFRNLMDAEVTKGNYASVKYIFNNKALVVKDEDGETIFDETPSQATGKKSDIWIVVKMTPEKFAEYSDLEGKIYISDFPVMSAHGFGLSGIKIPDTINKYIVTWIDYDETPLEKDEDVSYGAMPTFDGEEPTREGFNFTGWTPALSEVIRNIVFTYTYKEKARISANVTFSVVNGSWNGGGKDDKPVTLTGYEGDTLTLSGDQIPAVGGNPDSGYKAGSWDVQPTAGTEITGDTTYTYTYEADPQPEPTPTPPEPTPTPDPPAPNPPEPTPNPDPTPTPSPIPTPTPTPDGGTATGGGAIAAALPAAAAPAVVADNPTPLAEPDVIEDTPAPLAAPEGNWALINLIAAILSCIGAIVALFRRKDEDEEGYENEEDSRGRNMAIAKGLGAACAAASVIAFLLTEDMSLPMAMVDKWTVLMVALFAGQIVTAAANKKASKGDDGEEGAEA